MHVPEDPDGPTPATDPLGVDDLRVGGEQDVPAALPETHAPVQILAMQEIALIHGTHIFQSRPPHEHEGARYGLDRDWVRRQRQAAHDKALEPRIVLERTRQARGADEGPPGCRNGAPAAGLLGPVQIAHQTTSHAGLGMGCHHGLHLCQGLRPDQAVGIEEQQELPAGAIQHAIVGAREA